jgi:hypothetical protein
MKNIIKLISGILLIGTLGFAQTKVKNYPKEDAYPAPHNQDVKPASKGAFIALFEDWNVTNLHVYADPNEQPSQDFYYFGKPISPTFKDYLPDELRHWTHVEGYEPHAVFSLRGDGEEWYVLRIPDKEMPNQLVLYEMQNGELVMKQTLAFVYCDKKGCMQMDSWIQDVDGDTELDIIQTSQVTTRNGKVKEPKTVVLSMDKNGLFRKNKKANIDENDYRLEPISLK